MNGVVLNIAEKAVKEAESLGAEQVEVYSAISRTFSIEVENNAIRAALEKQDSGCGIRTVVGKKIGFAYVTTIAEDDVMDAVKSSVSLAKASLPDKDFESLPSFDGKYPVVKGLFNREIGSLDSEEAANLVLRAVDASKQAKIGDLLEAGFVILANDQFHKISEKVKKNKTHLMNIVSRGQTLSARALID